MRLPVWWLNLLILGVKPHRLDIMSKILEANKGMLDWLRGKCPYCVLIDLLTMLPTCCLNSGINHVLVEGDVALSKKRNAMKCWTDYCKWKKSYNGLVEVPYSFSDYFCEEPQSIKSSFLLLELISWSVVSRHIKSQQANFPFIVLTFTKSLKPFKQTNCQDKCWACTFLQTRDYVNSLHLICWHFKFLHVSIFIFLLWQRCA